MSRRWELIATVLVSRLSASPSHSLTTVADQRRTLTGFPRTVGTATYLFDGSRASIDKSVAVVDAEALNHGGRAIYVSPQNRLFPIAKEVCDLSAVVCASGRKMTVIVRENSS